MINKENINKNLWDVIKVHYEKECYTDSLKDVCLYIIQLIQEKSETDNLDGEKLITYVFSEKSPKLLINNYQTETEKDEQRGYGYLLRGLICSIRNPISHDNNFKFTKEQTDSILLFINNFLLPKLDDSKDFAYVDNWYEFIFESNDKDSIKYSNTILESIPKKEKFKLFIDIIENLSSIKKGKYKYFINKLFDSLTKKEQNEVIILLNKKLITVTDDFSIRMFFDHFEPTIWKKLDKLIKVRIEEMVYDSIKEGKSYIDIKKEKIDYTGSLGTWVNDWVEQFSNESDIIDLLFNKLESKEEADYVLKYFYDIITNEELLKKYSYKIINKLQEGNDGYKKLLDNLILLKDENNELIKKFEEANNEFEKNNKQEILPF